jgi:hypothetical protein
MFKQVQTTAANEFRQTFEFKHMTYNQRDKWERVQMLIQNVPVGTECTIKMTGQTRNGVVIGHTKTGQIKMRCELGRVWKTAYVSSSLTKSHDFWLVGSRFFSNVTFH